MYYKDITLIMENQMQKKKQHDMETVVYVGVI